jgi:hypothetical protein
MHLLISEFDPPCFICVGKLCVQTVKVEGAKTQLSRSDAAAICDSHPNFVDGGKPAASVNTWHYVHLK